MNYLAHAERFLQDASPEFIAGTAVPDWLNVVDRRTRCRERHAEPYLASSPPKLADLARGVVQHHQDDAWFHGTRAFTELSLEFSVRLREELGDASDLRAGFLGHILVELLMDRVLAENDEALLDRYYAKVATADAEFVARWISTMSGRDVSSLAVWIGRFCEVQFLRDYLDDALLAFRVNQVLGRVRLDPLPAKFTLLLPELHGAVAKRIAELLPQA